MKFGKEWEKRSLLLPLALQNKVYSYKKWKKISKSSNRSIDLIIKKIKRIFIDFHKYFINECKKTIVQKTNCLVSHYDIEILLELYELNKQTLYKICKRLDKRLNIDIFKKLNKTLLKNKIELFWIKRLKLEKEIKNIEMLEACPICFEDYNIKNNICIITNCGHIFCIKCFYKITNAYKLNGYIIEVINYNYRNMINNMDCPICRNKKPFLNFTKYNIYPLKFSKSILGLTYRSDKEKNKDIK